MKDMELKQEVEQLLAEVDKTHRYSMSKIYNLSNKVFSKTESPQSCASCLIRKVRELRKWLDSQPAQDVDAAKNNNASTKKRYKQTKNLNK